MNNIFCFLKMNKKMKNTLIRLSTEFILRLGLTITGRCNPGLEHRFMIDMNQTTTPG